MGLTRGIERQVKLCFPISDKRLPKQELLTASLRDWNITFKPVRRLLKKKLTCILNKKEVLLRFENNSQT